MVYIGCKLGSTGAALGVLHLRLTRTDCRAAVDAAARTSEVNPFFFLISDSGQNSSNSVRFCPNKKRKKKDMLPKDL